MLILTRKPGERIFIMDEDMREVKMCITLNSINGGQASLGIDADKKYTILREEVFLRNMQDQQGFEQGDYRNFEQDCEGFKDEL